MTMDPNRAEFIDSEIRKILDDLSKLLYSYSRDAVPSGVILNEMNKAIRALVEPDPGDTVLLNESVLIWRRTQLRAAAAIVMGSSLGEQELLRKQADEAERLLMVITDRVDDARRNRGKR